MGRARQNCARPRRCAGSQPVQQVAQRQPAPRERGRQNRCDEQYSAEPQAWSLTRGHDRPLANFGTGYDGRRRPRTGINASANATAPDLAASGEVPGSLDHAIMTTAPLVRWRVTASTMV